ncbi:MAG: FkbM family methyltransferase [Burkholderiaceae bacterium]|nr:FkbM family methyltransferase [Burkholderiaceae bacterium]
MPEQLHRRRSAASALRGIRHWFATRWSGSPDYTARIPALDMSFTVPMDTIFSWHLAKYRAYEPNISNWMLGRATGARDALYVDVGANFGWYTCLLARHGGPGAKVVAFEPAPATLARLRRNIQDNRCEDHVEVVAKGVGRESGTAHLHHAPDANPGMHSFLPMQHVGGDLGGEDLPIVTLDEALAHYAGRTVELLKIDVEGFEQEVLLGATKTLARTRALILEYSPAFLRKAGHDPRALPQLLADAGFTLHELTAGGDLLPLTVDAILAKAPGDNPDFFQFDLVGLRG